MPAVSIIVNVRNGATTLRSALQSALAQSFFDWEMIVWDDCSTDDSAEIVARFSDPRIRYFLAPKETSLGQARDAAMRCAQGEWLAFLDQDDLWLPRKIELQLALVDAPRVGLVYGRTLNFYPGGSQRDYDQFHEFAPLPEGDIFAELLGRGCFIAMSSALIRRTAVQETGGIPPDIHVIPDYHLYVAVCKKYAARAVQEVICLYRVHPGSMTSQYRHEALEEALRLVDRWCTHIQPRAYGKRRARIATGVALEEMRCWQTIKRGAQRLATDGSVSWLAARPFVQLQRIVARRVRTPQWKKSPELTDVYAGLP